MIAMKLVRSPWGEQIRMVEASLSRQVGLAGDSFDVVERGDRVWKEEVR